MIRFRRATLLQLLIALFAYRAAYLALIYAPMVRGWGW
jgi:hypothetical protein